MAKSDILARIPIKGASAVGGSADFQGFVPILNADGELDSSFGGGGGGTGNNIFLVANQAARLALSAAKGDLAKQADNGWVYQLSVAPASVNGNWVQISDLTVKIGELEDVVLTDTAEGDVLTYDAGDETWVNQPPKQSFFFLPTVLTRDDLKALPLTNFEVGQTVAFINGDLDSSLEYWTLLSGSADDSVVTYIAVNDDDDQFYWINSYSQDLGPNGYAIDFKNRSLQNVEYLYMKQKGIINLNGGTLESFYVQNNPSNGSSLGLGANYRFTGTGGVTIKLSRFETGQDGWLIGGTQRVINNTSGTITINNYSNALVAVLKVGDDVAFTALTSPNIWKAVWNVPHLVLGPGQSIRRNAADTAYEAYTPGSGGGGSGGNASYVVSNQAARLALGGLTVGDIVKESTTGEVYILSTLPSSVNGNWTLIADLIVSLQGLSDVQITSVQNGHVLTYNSTTSKWENKPIAVNPKFIGVTNSELYLSTNATAGLVSPYQIYIFINTSGEPTLEFWQLTEAYFADASGSVVSPPDYNDPTNPYKWVFLYACGTNEDIGLNSFFVGPSNYRTTIGGAGTISHDKMILALGTGAMGTIFSLSQASPTAISAATSHHTVRYSGSSVKTFTLPEISGSQGVAHLAKVLPNWKLHFQNESVYNVTINTHLGALVATVRPGDRVTFTAIAGASTWSFEHGVKLDVPPGYSIRRKGDNTGWEAYSPSLDNFATNLIDTLETVDVPANKSLITYHHLTVNGTLNVALTGYCVIL